MASLAALESALLNATTAIEADGISLRLYADWVASDDATVKDWPSMVCAPGVPEPPAWFGGLTKSEKPPTGNRALVDTARRDLGKHIGSGRYRGQCMEAVNLWIRAATGVISGGGGNPAGFVANCVKGGGEVVSRSTYAGPLPPAELLPGDVITVYPGAGSDWTPPIHTFIVGDPPSTAIQQNFPELRGVRDDLSVIDTLRGISNTGKRDDVHIVVIRFPPK